MNCVKPGRNFLQDDVPMPHFSSFTSLDPKLAKMNRILCSFFLFQVESCVDLATNEPVKFSSDTNFFPVAYEVQ